MNKECAQTRTQTRTTSKGTPPEQLNVINNKDLKEETREAVLRSKPETINVDYTLRHMESVPGSAQQKRLHLTYTRNKQFEHMLYARM